MIAENKVVGSRKWKEVVIFLKYFESRSKGFPQGFMWGMKKMKPEQLERWGNSQRAEIRSPVLNMVNWRCLENIEMEMHLLS